MFLSAARFNAPASCRKGAFDCESLLCRPRWLLRLRRHTALHSPLSPLLECFCHSALLPLSHVSYLLLMLAPQARGRKEASISDPAYAPLIQHLAALASSLLNPLPLSSGPGSPPAPFASPPPLLSASVQGQRGEGAGEAGAQRPGKSRARESQLLVPILKDVFGWEVSCVYQQYLRGEGDAERLLGGVPSTAPASPSPSGNPEAWAASPSPEGDARKLVARAMASPSASPSLRRRCGEG